jgi:hypothetical protein
MVKRAPPWLATTGRPHSRIDGAETAARETMTPLADEDSSASFEMQRAGGVHTTGFEKRERGIQAERLGQPLSARMRLVYSRRVGRQKRDEPAARAALSQAVRPVASRWPQPQRRPARTRAATPRATTLTAQVSNG